MVVSFVLGGTGMLRDAAISLADRSDLLISISRRSHLGYAAAKIEDMRADFADPAGIAAIINRVESAPQLSYGLIWIHSEHHPAARAIIAAMLARKPDAVAQVFGTSSSAQARSPEAFRDEFSPSGAYFTVELGQIGSRWLTEAEISAGALASLYERRDVIVGNL